jgi:hypothetical protein
MNLVPLKIVEFWREVRGPGSRRDGDVRAVFTTERVKPGEATLSPTGLAILWDRAASAVYVIQPDAKEHPCIVLNWHEVRRCEPESYEWLSSEMRAQQEAASQPQGKHGRG